MKKPFQLPSYLVNRINKHRHRIEAGEDVVAVMTDVLSKVSFFHGDLWVIERLETHINISRFVDGNLDAGYAPRSLDGAAVDLAAIAQGFLPPRRLQYFDKPAQETEADNVYRPEALPGVARDHALVSHKVGELDSCFGVELQPVGHTPFGEVVRVNVHTNNPDPSALVSFAARFCGHQPLFVGPMEFIAILKHGAEAKEVLFSEPSHSNDLNLHTVSP
jgi:hypothetical protein